MIALRVEAGKEFDYRPLISFYLALFFCGSGFISMGLFFSSLTKSQIIGAMLTFVGMLALLDYRDDSKFAGHRSRCGKRWPNTFLIGTC